jgi:two-component system, OmpR family, phosphate regulon sensor histidine kinase PhoR
MKRRPFFWSIFPAFVLITFISGILIIIFSVRTFKEIHSDSIYDKMLGDAAFMKAYIARTDSAEVAKLDSLVEDFSANSVTRITVTDESGLVLADSKESAAVMENHLSRPEFQAAIKGETGKSVRFSSTIKKEMMYVTIPVFTSNGRKYIVRTAYPLLSLSDTIFYFQTKVLWIVLLVIVLLAGVSLYVSKRLSAPLIQLKDKAKKFANGDFSQEIEEYSQSETNQLSETMNFMAIELDDKIKNLESRNREQTAILKSMIEGVIAIDMNDRILLINESACRILGVDHNKAQGKLIQEVIRITKVQEYISSLIKRSELLSVRKEISINTDDKEVTVHFQGSSLQKASGETIGAVIVLHDVTDIRKLENLRREFVANVSHELRTPLTSIKGFVETLIDEQQSAEDRARFLNIIQKHVDRLNSILEDLLMLATLEKDEKDENLELAFCKVDSIIENVKELCQSKSQQKKITVISENLSSAVVRCSQQLIEQALLNLVDNAIKYSPVNSEIFIRCFDENGFVKISVTDKGQGINKIHFNKIFERFYRIDKSRSRKEGGTGLGLAIVKHIMNLHKGTAAVESEEGKGSTFTLVLPK